MGSADWGADVWTQPSAKNFLCIAFNRATITYLLTQIIEPLRLLRLTPENLSQVRRCSLVSF
jgi:hypothetical protein